MKKQLFIIALLTSTNAFSQQADSTLIGNSFEDVSQYIQQQTTQPQIICPSAVLQWGVQGIYCKQSIAEAETGNEQYLIDQDVTDNSYGSARYTCQNGNWVNTSASCSAPTQVNNMPYNMPNEPVENHNMPYTIPNETTEPEPEPETNITTNTPVVTTPNSGKTYCADKNHTTCTIRYGSGKFWY